MCQKHLKLPALKVSSLFPRNHYFCFGSECIKASTEKKMGNTKELPKTFHFYFSSELHLVQLTKVLSHIVADSCSFNCSLGLILMGKIQGILTIQRLTFNVLRLLGRINQYNLVYLTGGQNFKTIKYSNLLSRENQAGSYMWITVNL